MSAALGRRFLVVWFGQSVSALGSILSGVGMAVWVYVETGSTAWLGLLSALAAVPFVLTGPAMPIVDRLPRRTVMIGADVLAASGTVVALALAVAGRLEVWHLAVVGFVGGVGTAFQFPAFQAAIPALVTRDALGRANGINQLGPAAGVVIGPMFATPLVAWWGIGAVLAVDLISFLVAVVCTVAVRFDDPPPDPDVADDRTWSAAFGWLRSDGRAIAVLLGVMAVVNFCLAFFNIALISLATDVGGTARAGLVLGAAGVAMLVGTIVLGRTGVSPQRIRTFDGALLAAGAGFTIAALRPSFALLVVGVVVALAAVPAVNAAVSTIYHERVPSSMQGRVFGLRSAIGRGLEPLGSVIAGFVIASVAAPAMADGGAGASTIGRLIGVGDHRGAAAVVLAVGVALALIGIWLLRSWIRADLDGVDPATVGNVDDAVADGTAPIGCPTDPAVTGGG
jgi:MFS transporter, DHA3 family, macrolide efflux protein